MSAQTNFLVGIFDDDDAIINASRNLRTSGVRIHEVYSPFPLHGIDDALGYKRSRLPIAAFMFGVTGLIFAASMQSLMLGLDWPMNIGGKPFIAPPTFVPVTFELTVLFTALGMVGTFLVSSGLGPGAQKMVLDPRSTDDKFVLAIDMDKNKSLGQEKITELLRHNGAAEVYEKQV